MRDNLTGYYRY